MLPSFFKKLGPIGLDEIQNKIKCNPVNLSENDKFSDFVSIDKVNEKSLSFLYDGVKLLKKKLPSASSVICTEKVACTLDSEQKIIKVKNVQETVAKISHIFYRDLNNTEVDELDKPVVGKNFHVGKNVEIENGAIIGNNVKIGHNTVIKHSCIIGDNSEIGSNTTISHSILGEDIYVGSNTSIGQRGFGFYLNDRNNINIFHTGRVILKPKVSIGSGCTIDRGSFSDTIIGENTYLDNLCHIAHNVVIGNNCAFAAMTGIAGSTQVGNNVLTGGQAGIAGHITIGNNVQIAAKSGVFKNLDAGVSVMGNPAINMYSYLKNYKKYYGKR